MATTTTGGATMALRSTAAGALFFSTRAMKMPPMETAKPMPDRISGSATAMTLAEMTLPSAPLIGPVSRCASVSSLVVRPIAIVATIAATSDS